MRTTTTKRLAIAAVTTLALFTAACGSGSDSDSDATDSSPPMDDSMSSLVGPGCEDYAEQVPEGEGSVQGMAQDPVATAASNNPLLTMLVSAVSGEMNPDVDLVETLNGDEFTVFAPVDDAFAKLPEDTVETLGTSEGSEMLSDVLTYHVVAGQISPDDIAGEHETLNGGTVEVTGEGDNIKVNDASVICGGVKTSNATVYMIDTVLMPAS